jgi:proline iminopeptidase
MLRFLLVVLLIVPLSACTDEKLQQGEGYINVAGGKVWYKVVGSGKKTPLLLLHGGPGFTSHYLEPLVALSDERPVIFYDQLGGGRSEVTYDPSLWTIDRFVAELAMVRKALNLDEVHILGHSWGTQLAVDYMLTKPSGVKSLILASPALNVPRWTKDNKELLRQLPPEVLETIVRHESEGSTNSEEYQIAMMVFYHKHLSLSDPWSAELNKTFEMANQDLYGYMWGASDWAATGTLKDYNREGELPSLNLPVLFTTGRFDEARPNTVAHFQSLIPGATFSILEKSAHLTMQDQPEEYNRIVRDFLNSVEQPN